jgi:hypothetical protein
MVVDFRFLHDDISKEYCRIRHCTDVGRYSVGMGIGSSNLAELELSDHIRLAKDDLMHPWFAAISAAQPALSSRISSARPEA